MDYNANRTSLFLNSLPDLMLALKGETCHGGKSVKEGLMILLAPPMTRLLRYKVDFQSMQLDDLPPDAEYDLDDY
uniref:Uncharacterized protein n=1 Tax=Timema monikensis TaxID=170555 RepID=A0A7R9EI05_9NEOP|nr:unnamed protein product [Timema monikensis]